MQKNKKDMKKPQHMLYSHTKAHSYVGTKTGSQIINKWEEKLEN